jgi:TolB protein
MKYILALLILFSGTLGFTDDSSQDIRVHLNTESALSSIYLSHVKSIDSSFPSNYIKELEKVLDFDFNYNGRTKVSNRSNEKDSILLSMENNPSNMKSVEAPFAVFFSLKDKKLHCKVYNFLKGHANSFPEVSLTGTLSADRLILHKLSDAIHKVLFQENGIAYSRILYSYHPKTTSKEQNWNAEIIECDWDGENPRVVTREKSYCVTPVLLPKSKDMDQDMFLYVSYKTGQPKIFISALNEGKGKKVVDLRGNQVLPAISKNRDKIAFICDASGRADLFVQSMQPKTGLTGTPKQLFSYPKSTQGSPTFSPDGSKIAFVSDKDGAPRIYCISSEASNKRAEAQLITKKNRESSAPSWSPDGTKLAYSAKTKGVRQIWTYTFSTGEEKQLTYGPGNKENPTWASNSLHLVFNSTDNNSSDLYIVNLNQPEAVKITKGQGKKHYPTWGAR